MMAHINRNCWTDLVQGFTMVSTTPRQRVRIPPTNRLEPGLRIESPLGPKSPKKLAIPPASFFPFSTEVPQRVGRARNYGAPMVETSGRTTGEAGHSTGGSGQPAFGAAFFDLDRTLLSGASGPAISAALRAVGLMSERAIPGQDLVFGIFNAFGETLPSMMLTRQAASMAARWPRSKAQEAGRRAAETLIDLVQPYAKVLIEEHRAAGRPVVIATTTPYDLVRPLADLLGIDAVIATRYGERDGVYTGTIDGEFVWNKGKYRAVKEWADEHDVSLEDSYACSDSYYDVPLLNAVGHPFVVNPDPRMRLQ